MKVFLRQIFRKAYSLYNYIFRPPTVDIALQRREKLAILYGVSSFSLFVYVSVLALQLVNTQEFSDKAIVPHNVRMVKYKFDTEKLKFEEVNDQNNEHNQGMQNMSDDTKNSAEVKDCDSASVK